MRTSFSSCRGCAMQLLNIDGYEEPRGNSYCSPQEVEICAALVRDILDHNNDLHKSDIGIISPYAAHKQELQRKIKGVDVNNTDAFQGQERAVIILTTVRSNTTGRIGFLGDYRRVNVSLTRARRSLL